VVITLGYAATFLAGFSRDRVRDRRSIHRRFCAARGARRSIEWSTHPLLRDVVQFRRHGAGRDLGGSILGPILGWDPKENGAVLIVFWNALILHARWAGWCRRAAFMNLAIFGNAVTSWSWFGTNYVGVGLHSYGFMDFSRFLVSPVRARAAGLDRSGLAANGFGGGSFRHEYNTPPGRDSPSLPGLQLNSTIFHISRLTCSAIVRYA